MKITLKNGGLEDLLSRSRTQKELEKIVAETKTRTTMQLYSKVSIASVAFKNF